MNRGAIVLAALAVLGLAVGNIVLGMNLVTPRELAQERGAGAPWILVWAMIGVTVGTAVVLGGLLVSSLVKR